MIEVVSLVGLSYSGKSTLAEALVPRLSEEGIVADIIKKDDALRAVGEQRYGSEGAKGGYSIANYLRHGQIPSSELHAHMNTQVHNSLGLGHLAILEGGTRTRAAQAETLDGIEIGEDGLVIYLLDLPFRETIRRARQRRKETNRYDDSMPIALAKLQGQYRGARSSDAPKICDPDVFRLDAKLKPEKLVEQVAMQVIASHFD